ncbi:SpoIIE family protein phosphatase [Streptomyces sp. NBC_01142]|uniref:SpoIIE family protein phosphatase n=1 Tax=Streptomyces sp. NBC_01142 TaxID=2975865 RepID=UPI0022595E54|nr:SpoIIE family protein phosphatase [Streptomyces sp. NBC_01142]MCX4825876.1 SpoIIE family protein phosphatase [Streptomyces sp. NBC_01142]
MREFSFQGNSGEFPEPGGEVDVLLDARGVVVGWEAGAARMLGYSAQEALGRPVSSLLGIEADFDALIRRPDKDAVARLGSIALRRRDGDPVQAEVWARPLVPPFGESQWLLQAARTDAIKAYELGQALLEGLFTNSPLYIDVFDSNIRFLAQNRRWGAAGRPSVVGQTMREAYQAVDLLDFEALEARQRQVLDSGDALIGTEVVGHVVSKSGQHESRRDYVWSESILPLKNRSGDVIALAHAVTDVTARARARDRLVLGNEASTRIGTTLDLLQTVRELADVAVPRFADFAYVNLLDGVFSEQDPPNRKRPETMVLRRAVHRSVFEDGQGAGDTLELGTPVAVGDVDAFATAADSPSTAALSHGKPVLLRRDEFREALAAVAPGRTPSAHELAVRSWLLVPMFARGAALGTAVFARCRDAHGFDTDDVLLAQEVVARAAVCVDNASRYGRERTTALTLQRNLLPQRLPSSRAVEAVSRYLPASGHAGLGGDWFDVIPLSGARVALVVGDVEGHHLHSAVTMGRLRTAVRTLAELDLPPEELLAHLDDQVNRFADERGGDDTLDADQAIGATCAYAIYDPVSRQCVMARAGHPPPAVVSGEGKVDFVDLPGGPPLGLGGVVFESAEIKLSDGDLLVLYTDGLVESREQSLDAGLELLRGRLSRAPKSADLDELCDGLISELLPAQHEDDVALLVARTHGLPSDCCITWDVEKDPQVVPRIRELTTQQTERWGLVEEAFVTELVVSELVTNAIRYGEPPITLRLIRADNLICEVSDGSSTSPHVRRAAHTDEGGRGLYLVTQLTHSWGTRYHARGKTIWAEQVLPS